MRTFSGCYISLACFRVIRQQGKQMMPRVHTLLNDLGGIFLSLFRSSASQANFPPFYFAAKVVRTSNNVWMPAEFCADCRAIVSAS